MNRKYKVFYSEEDKEWVAINEDTKTTHLDSTPLRALEGLLAIMPDIVEIMYKKV